MTEETTTLGSLIAYAFLMAALWFALAGAVRLQKWIEHQRTRRLQQRQYGAWLIAQQRRQARGDIAVAAKERREAARDISDYDTKRF